MQEMIQRVLFPITPQNLSYEGIIADLKTDPTIEQLPTNLTEERKNGATKDETPPTAHPNVTLPESSLSEEQMKIWRSLNCYFSEKKNFYPIAARNL